jgi:HPt (histidine-containing phosphotransfer) domain-containing protein
MGVNIQGFQNLCEDPDSLRQLIELYLTKTTEQMLELEKGIKSNSPSTVARLAHAIAGANLMVGVEAPVPLLRQLEDCGDKGELVKAGAIFEELDAQFKVLCGRLKEQIP